VFGYERSPLNNVFEVRNAADIFNNLIFFKDYTRLILIGFQIAFEVFYFRLLVYEVIDFRVIPTEII